MSASVHHKITLETVDTTVDDPCGFTITGCPPNGRVDAGIEFDYSQRRYRASATFRADADGRIDTARDPSLGGGYVGTDPFGLFWSAFPVGPGVASGLAPIAGVLTIRTARETVSFDIVRRWLPAHAVVTEVRAPGVTGLFVRPAGPGPFPAVVAFGGSGGGLGPAASWAAALAGHGFATLAISYFGAPGLPDGLIGIEIECVDRAISWLRRQPEVGATRVGVMGASRGSELALWAGVHFPAVGAVVGFAPSGVSWCGLGPVGPVDAPAWTHRGASLPYASLRGRPAGDGGRPVALRPIFDDALSDVNSIRPAEIPVEQIDAPILLISGEDDAMWPSTPMGDIAVRRAAERGFRHDIRHLHYRGAGHTGSGIPGVPVDLEVKHPLDGGYYAFGGCAAGNAAARAASWPQVIAFLDSALSAQLV